MLDEPKSKFWETILIAGLSALATGLANLIVEEIKERKKKKKTSVKHDQMETHR